MSHDSALIVFAKHPAPGRVKTRLTPPLTPEEAAELYRRMLLDTLAKVRSFPNVRGYLFYQDEPAALTYFQGIAPDFVLLPQEGYDLGARMAGAFREVLSRGCRRVVIVGTDAPDLPVDYLHQAFRTLADDAADAVFGPSADGGYYLLALKAVPDCLFEGIAWSTGTVLAESLARAEEAGLRVHLLPGWHDVDTCEDLQRCGLVDAGNGALLTRDFVVRHLADNLSGSSMVEIPETGPRRRSCKCRRG